MTAGHNCDLQIVQSELGVIERRHRTAPGKACDPIPIVYRAYQYQMKNPIHSQLINKWIRW